MFRKTVRQVAAAILVCTLLTAIGRPAWAQAESEAATRQYAVAAGFQNQKLYDQAVEEWTAFLKKFPNDPRRDKARHYLGVCHLQAGDFEGAIAAFDAVAKQHPQFELLDASLLNLGIASYGRAQKSAKAADYKSAEQAFAGLVTRFPKSEHVPQALFYQGESLYQQQQHAEAAAAYTAVTKDHAKSPFAAEALYALGVTREALKQGAQAEAAYAEFLTQHARHALANEVRMRQAELLFARGEHARAEPLFGQLAAVEDFALGDVAMLRQARCLYEQGRYPQAGQVYWDVPRRFRQTKHYETAVLAGAKCYYLDGQYPTARAGLEIIAGRDAPEAAEASQWIARCHLKENDAAKALEVLDAAIQRHAGSPHLPQLLLARADTLYEIPARRSETVALYAEFAQKYPDDPQAAQALYMAGLTALQVENHAAAKSHSDAFLNKFANDKLTPDVLFIAAESRLLQGDHAGAADSYRRFLTAAPQHASGGQARVRLGLALQLQKKFDESLAHLAPLVDGLTDPALQSEALYLVGRGHAEQQQHAKAAEALERSLKAGPDRDGSDETRLALAEAYRQLNRNADASAQLERLVKDFPRSPRLDEAWYRLGEYAYADGDFARAIESYTRVVGNWPDGAFAPHAQYGIGWAHFNRQNFAGATEAMGRLIETYPQSEVTPRAYYIRAMASLQSGRHQQAQADVEKFLASRPAGDDSLDALYVLGLCQAGLQQHAAAAETFQEILKKSPRYGGADKVLYELAWTYAELDKPDESAAAFGRLAKEHADSPLAAESLFRVGETLYGAGKYAEAARAYTEARAKAGATDLGEKAMHKLAWSHLKAEQVEQAAGAFETQLGAFPDGALSADATFLAGECRFQRSQWKEALVWYDKVIAAREPRYHALALYRSGQCTGSLEDWAASQKFHRQVLDQFADFEQRPEARYGLAWALHNQDKLSEAVREYEQVTEETESETAAKARFMIGECYFAQKDHKQAVRHFLKAAYGYGHEEWSAMAFFEAARCFEVLKDLEQARTSYRNLLEKFPKHTKAAEARKRLAELMDRG